MRPNTSPGLLIAIEGIDGAGKSTVLYAVSAAIEASGMEVVRSAEPTRGQWGQAVRATFATQRLSAEQEAELLLRDRREHVEHLVEPALKRGAAVVLDRYYPSMVAYQGAAGLPVDWLLRANDFAPRPDVLIVLDLPADVALARIRRRGDVPNTFEKLDALQRCRDIFRGFADQGAVLVDATQPPEAVAAASVELVRRRLQAEAA